MRSQLRRLRARLLFAAVVAAACVTRGVGEGSVHRWWAGFGPVLPHDTFPADCKLCHVGEDWNSLTDDFRFDHAAETGVPLHGAHAQARCLRCHNDRGPVAVFHARGCAGCHEDVHKGELGATCTACHQESTWRPFGQYEKHFHSRFPLTGAHANVACHRCHLGARAGDFAPADPECVTCHLDDARNARNPPHVPLGFVDDCQRCHIPTTWRQAQVPAPLQRGSTVPAAPR